MQTLKGMWMTLYVWQFLTFYEITVCPLNRQILEIPAKANRPRRQHLKTTQIQVSIVQILWIH